MQEVRELIGTRADLTEHLTKLRDRLLADERGLAKPADKQRMHGRAEGVELVLRELAVWTQTDAGADPLTVAHEEYAGPGPQPGYGVGDPG